MAIVVVVLLLFLWGLFLLCLFLFLLLVVVVLFLVLVPTAVLFRGICDGKIVWHNSNSVNALNGKGSFPATIRL